MFGLKNIKRCVMPLIKLRKIKKEIVEKWGASVYLFLNSEPHLDKSKESNSQGIKVQVKRAF